MSNPALNSIGKNKNIYATFDSPIDNHWKANQVHANNRTAYVQIPDVVIKTMVLFALLVPSATFAAYFYNINPAYGNIIWFSSLIIATVLSFVIIFKKKINIPLILLYAVFEGAGLGGLSMAFESQYPGIVLTAVTATLCVYAAMLALYYTRIVKVTEKFKGFLFVAVSGYLLFMLVNFGFAMFGANNGWGMFALGSPVSILVSLVGVGLASFTTLTDFDEVEKIVSAGDVPQIYSWKLAFGIVLGIVWLYVEILRLIANLMEMFKD